MPALFSFEYAILRVVPRVEREEFVNAGVVLRCREKDFLGAASALDPRRLAAFAPDLDPGFVQAHLDAVARVCAGEGPIGRLPPGERFHWLVAPRSTLLQPSPVHTGLCADPAAMLRHLLDTMVKPPPSACASD